MTNLYLQKKSIERNKFYKILISLMVLSFTAFLSYSFISCIKDIDIPSLYMLGNTLYTLPYLIIFFIFFTFECCYKLNRYYEPICVTKKGMRSVYKNQLQSIFCMICCCLQRHYFLMLFIFLRINSFHSL